MENNRKLNHEQAAALRTFRTANGRSWKAKLMTCWGTGNYGSLPFSQSGPLQRVRNEFGPAWLQKLSTKELEAAAAEPNAAQVESGDEITSTSDGSRHVVTSVDANNVYYTDGKEDGVVQRGEFAAKFGAPAGEPAAFPVTAESLRQAIPDSDGPEGVGYRSALESMALALMQQGVSEAVIGNAVTTAIDAYVDSAEASTAYTVVGHEEESNVLIIAHVSAEDSLNAFASAAAKHPDAMFSVAVAGHWECGKAFTLPGESLVSAETVAEQTEVFGDPYYPPDADAMHVSQHSPM